MIFNILTVFNTIVLVLILITKKGNLSIAVDKVTTFSNNTLVGYRIMLWRRTSEYSSEGVFGIYIPIKNKRKTELSEEITRMKSYTSSSRARTLRAKFSWLKTLDEVKKFERDYKFADEEVVMNLVNDFINKRKDFDAEIEKLERLKYR